MLSALVAVVVSGTPAEPPQTPAPLRWHVPASQCPRAEEVQAAVVDLAGRWPSAAELEVEGTLAPDPNVGWTLELTVVVSGRPHRQQLQAATCSALGRAAALIVAVSLDPVSSAATLEVPLPEPDAPDVVEPPVLPSSVDRREAAPQVEAPRRPPRLSGFLGFGWAGVLGMTPGPSTGPALSLGLERPRSRFVLHGRYVLPRATERSPGARVQAGTVGVSTCLLTAPRTVRASLCATVETGAVRARGIGFAAPQTRHYPWLAGVIGAGLRARFTRRWAFAADVEGAVAAFDAEVVGGPTDVAQPSIVFANARIGARLVLGVEVSFGGLDDGSAASWR